MRCDLELDLTRRRARRRPVPGLAERAGAAGRGVARAEGTWLAFDHAAVERGAARPRLGRIWTDREPAGDLEPFNLLHRNQMMENEPPEHTRLRRLVAAAFNRGHVERLRPRVRELAAELLDEVDPAGFDLVARLRRAAAGAGHRRAARRAGRRTPTSCAPGRRRSCGCTSRRPPTRSSTRRCAPRPTSPPCARAGRASGGRRRATTWSPTWSRPTRLDRATRSSPPSCCCSTPATRRRSTSSATGSSRCCAPRPDAGRASRCRVDCVEEMLRFDSALQLFERTATAPRRGRRRARSSRARRSPRCSASANRDPAVFERRRRVRRRPRPQPARRASGSGCTSASAAPLARMELAESLRHLLDTLPGADARGGARVARHVRAARLRTCPSRCQPLSTTETGGATMAETHDAVEVIIAKRDGGELSDSRSTGWSTPTRAAWSPTSRCRRWRWRSCSTA